MDSLRPLGGDQRPVSSPSAAPVAPPPQSPAPQLRPATPRLGGLPPQGRIPIPPRPGKKAETKSRAAKHLYTALALVILAGLMGGGRYFDVLTLLSPASPRAITNAFFRAQEDYDFGIMIKLCTAETRQLIDPTGKLAGIAPKVSSDKPKQIASWRVGKAHISGETAQVEVMTTLNLANNKSSFTQNVNLIKENGKWKVDLASKIRQAMQALRGLGNTYGGRQALPLGRQP